MKSIEMGDLLINDCGQLGSQYALSEHLGKQLGIFSTEAQVCRAIRKYCERVQYWPNIFRINDHGNIMQVRLKNRASN